MKQWWFRYAIQQLIEKLIIPGLLFIFLNFAINQSSIEHRLLPNNSVSMCCMAAMSPAGRFVIYLFGMGVVYFECTSTCCTPLLPNIAY